MDNTSDIAVLSLCTGYGGLELGLHRALGRPLRVVAVEIEAFAAANLVAKAEEGKLAIEAVYADIKTFPAERFSGCFDFILAGFPCQPFSTAGLRRGTEDERHLWPDIERTIAIIRPAAVFLENVPGLLSTYTLECRPKLQDYCRGVARRLGDTFAAGFMARLARYAGIPVLQYVAHRLEAMGYECAPGIFSAKEIGAPHQRERLFILAVANSQHGRFYSEERFNNAKTRSASEGELANPSRLGRGGRDNGEPAGQGRALQTEGPSELANSRPDDGRQCEPREQQKKLSEEFSGGGELADAASQRIQGHESTGGNQPEGQAHELRYDRWPARPGQEQYDWEEPRTVESGMGRTVDGFASRVDELRLLGNGVVPAQAELAFRTLYEQLTK